jgi:RHS repeat-associated protein
MARWSSRHGAGPRRVFSRRRYQALAVTLGVTMGMGTVAPVALAAPGPRGLPSAQMFGYAKGPAQKIGSAAGRAHYVPATATQARAGGVKGHRAPKLRLVPPPIGTRTLVRVPAVRMPRGHVVVGRNVAPSAGRRALEVAAASGADNATYGVASTFDTVPMADQSGRIAVTVTNTGTSTWDTGYALGTAVFPASDTNGSGTPLTTGPTVPIGGSVTPNGTTVVESVTPAENPGSYTICWDMTNDSGTYFSAEGGNEHCAPYTIQQYPAQVTEQEPLPGADADTQSPALTATATVPGGYPANPVFTFAFRLLNGPNPSTATVLQSSGWVSGNSDTWTPGTDLTWGTTYYWQVTVTDAATPPSLSSATWTTPISFTVGNAQPGVSGQFGPTYQADDGNPVMTSDLGGSDYSGSGKTVDPRTGNVSQQVTDANEATAGPALAITRTYNSLDPRTSQALGAGWSSELDMSLAPDSDGSGALILTLTDGQQVRFAKNAAGGYAPPESFYAVINTVTGGGFTVTDQIGTTWTFAQASGSSWLLSKIVDANGLAETLSYSSGSLTTITNTSSGRALHLTWSTPSGAAHPHVATVSTDPVTAAQQSTALTWTYGYNGDLLTSVCPPGTTTACTTYGYSNSGSHAPTAVMNTNPDAYYRLADSAGASAAANLEPVDELTTLDPPATEMNTTPGATGPISGVSATSFNGSSSWIPLDGMWCDAPGDEGSCGWVPASGRVLSGNGLTSGNTTLNDLAISVWFKTSATSGVLAGISGVVPGQTSCLQVNSSSQCTKEADAVPLLWIDSSGHLNGLNTISTTSLNTSAATGMTSTAAVNNSTWHQAVLVPGRALYLDGKQIATGSGQTLTLPGPAQGITAPDIAMLGAGLSSLCSGCKPPLWQYFNGSMADVAIWQNQVPGPDAVAAQYSAETTPAAELATITSPAGRTDMSSSYDTVNDRLKSLTDAEGGTWTFSSPVNSSTAGAYDSAVVSDSPEDFWPLSDTSGTQAGNLVGSARTAANPRPPATYSNATLGVAGPMTDQSAVKFSGSSAQVSVPTNDFNTAGPVSAEAWFNTTATGQEFILKAANGALSGDPLVLQVKGGCLQANLQDAPFTVAKQSTCGTSSNFVDDGGWHQAVATLGPASAPSGGKVTQTLTLYQDGVSVGSVAVSTSPTASSGDVTYIGQGFTGSLADVSVYPAMLTSGQVAGHFAALASQQGTVDPNGNPLPPLVNTQTVTVTNPLGGAGKYVYASGALVEQITPVGGIIRFGYDAAMRADTITDPDGDTTYATHDAHNNVTSTTTCAAINNCQTAYTSYYENLSNPLDPRNDKPTDNRDARSSSPSDPAYDTVIAYTSKGQIASKTTPPTTACPAGCKTSYTYTTGSEAAVGGGTEPAGLLASVTSPGGGVISYEYDSAGDVAQVTDPLGLVTKYGYDNLGRELSETEVSDSYPNGLTTSYTYDGQDHVLTETDPSVTDRVTGAVHTKVTSYSYDPDGNVLTSAVSDSTGGDASRTSDYGYDTHDNLASVKDPLGNTTTYTYDAMGDRLTQTNPAGVTYAYAYDTAANLLNITLKGYTGNPSNPIPAENLVEQSRAYDPAGRVASVTNVMGVTTDYTYYGDNRLASSYVVCSSCSGGRESAHIYSYDPAGNPVSLTAPGGLVVNSVFNADNEVTSQVIDPTGVDTTATARYDAAGNMVTDAVSGGGATQTQTMTYNAVDEVLSRTVDNIGGNLTTTYKRDQRGLVIAETDPAGNTTTIQNDEAGQPVVETDPAVPSQTGNGSAPVTANPITMTGYNTFGEKAEYSDADGNVTTYRYDPDGNQTSAVNPSYTPPGASSPVNGTTTFGYDSLGQEISQTDPDGNVTKYAYDQLGDKASQTDPGSGVWNYTYDPAGEQLSVTDPTGAQTQATYDALGRLLTTTDLVRQNTSAAYTTSYGYDDAGNLISQTSPAGVKTTAIYNAVGEKTSSTDGAQNTTSYAYDVAGHMVKETLPDGTAVAMAYDQAGRKTSQSDLSVSGAVLRTESSIYNPDGDITSATDFRDNTSTFSYDATGQLLSQTQPTSSGQSTTVSFGYDLAGHRTALTDGNGNTTYTTYNALGLPETVTEPQTAQYATAATSTTTDIYDGNGNLITQNLPGGVQTSNTYDPNGNLLTQSGTGASAPTATRTFSYDAANRMLTAATTAAGTQGSFGYQPATSESFTWDDRGLLLSAAGSAGATSYTYNSAGQEASVTDAAGTSSFGYDSAGRLATDADAASGVTGAYSYNSLDQVTSIGYGTGNDTQSFGYDNLHRLTSDTVATASGATLASIGYGYDANDNVTSMTTTGLASLNGIGTVTNTYAYDQANRLTSWTASPSGGTAVTKTYGYDNNGNLINNNGVAQTYDARNELVSDGNGNSYSYTANGDLVQQSSPGNAVYNFTSDAYGQQITDGFSSFAWDALNRVISSGEAFNNSYNVTLTYEGMTKDVASDPSATYSRDPSGQITGVNTSADGKTVALVDAHSDLSGTFVPAGTAMASSTTWDPWGQVIASTGPAIQNGYQGQWTDPTTGQVSMGARFYRPVVGGFIDQDTYTGDEGGTAVTDNQYAYADDNPATLTDPTGHAAGSSGGGGATVTYGDVTAAHSRAVADAQKAAQLNHEAAQALQAEAKAEKAAQSAATLAKNLNAQANKLEAEASQAAALAAAWYRGAQAELQNAQHLESEAKAATAAAQRDQSLVTVYTIMDPQPLVAAQFQREANAETQAAQNYQYAAAYAYLAYSNAMAEYQAELDTADQLRMQAALVRFDAMLAGVVAATDAAVAATYRAKAKALAAAAAAATKQAAAAESEYKKLAYEYVAEQAEKLKQKEAALNAKVQAADKACQKAHPHQYYRICFNEARDKVYSTIVHANPKGCNAKDIVEYAVTGSALSGSGEAGIAIAGVLDPEIEEGLFDAAAVAGGTILGGVFAVGLTIVIVLSC